jgi:hypothetical protein
MRFDVSVEVTGILERRLAGDRQEHDARDGTRASPATPANQVAISLDGYSARFLTLKPFANEKDQIAEGKRTDRSESSKWRRRSVTVV